MQLVKLVLGDTFTHRTRTRDTTSDHLEELVAVVCSAPLLVLHHVDGTVHLGLLDQLAVGAHAVLRVGLGELVADQRGRVQAGQRDELPAVAQGGQASDVGLLLVARHGGFPVEGRGQIIRESEEGGVIC